MTSRHAQRRTEPTAREPHAPPGAGAAGGAAPGLGLRRAHRHLGASSVPLPLLLVVQMSASDWPLLERQPGAELPAELRRRGRPPPLLGRDRLHAQVHRHHDRAAARARARARAARAGVDRAGRLPPHVVPHPERARPRLGVPALLRALLPLRRPVRRPHGGRGASPSSAPPRPPSGRRSSSSSGGSPASTCCSCSWACRASPTTSSRRPASTARPAGRRSATSPLPLLRPTFALTTVLCVTGSLLAFDQFYILTKGGPDNSTMTIVQLIYNVAFQGQNNLGIAGALSVSCCWRSSSSTSPSCALPPPRGVLIMAVTDTTSTRRDRRRRQQAGRRRRRRAARPRRLGVPYDILTAGLAIIFLYPLVWTTVSSFAPRAGTSQTDGWGFGNYVSLANYQAGIWVVPRQLAVRVAAHRGAHPHRLVLRRLRVRPLLVPGQEPAVPARRWRS